MHDYSFLIEDDRYSVPTLRLASLADDETAKAMAREILSESDHHLAVDVTRDGAVASSLRVTR